MEIHGQLVLACWNEWGGEASGRWCFFHGGSRRQMLPGWHYDMLYYSSQTYGFNQYLASKGYVVLSINLSGRNWLWELIFREPPGLSGATGASCEFNDVLAAGLYLRGRADVDPARIGAWGGSVNCGGYLTDALALALALLDLFCRRSGLSTAFTIGI